MTTAPMTRESYTVLAARADAECHRVATATLHANHPHEAGTLYDCLACESLCYCQEGRAMCLACALAYEAAEAPNQ